MEELDLQKKKEAMVADNPTCGYYTNLLTYFMYFIL